MKIPLNTVQPQKILPHVKSVIFHLYTRYICETQMPLIRARSKDGHFYKDKYLDTSAKILWQKMLMCDMKALIIIIL